MVTQAAPTILLVDTDKESRNTFGSVLREAGFGVREAGTGGEALRLAAEQPSLVIMDMKLPDMDGHEVCRRIKQHPATQAIPILHFSTACTRSEERTLSLEHGADANLLKPARPEELLAHVKALFRLHEAEQQLRTTANQWKTAFDGASDPVSLVDVQGNVLRCNKAMAELLGLPFTAIVAHAFFPVVQAALAPGLVPDLTRVHRTGRRERLELCAGKRWFHITADPVHDDSGKVIGSVQVYADITEFKRADGDRIRLLTERAQLADHLNLLLESTEEGICGIDLRGRFTFINRAGAALLGCSPSALIGQNFHTSVHHSHRDGRPSPENDSPLKRALASGEGCRVASEVLWRRDGAWFPAEYSAHPIHNSAGESCGLVVTFTDVSERRRLEQLFAESQKLEAIGRLAAGLAHDFNNLLTVIVGNVGILMAGCPEDHADRATFQAVDRAAWRAVELIGRLLSFSKQSRLNLKPIDLRAAVAETEGMLRSLLDPRVTVNIQAHPQLWSVHADSGQINQVLLNLCLNARDAMPEGGRLTLQTENVTLDQRTAGQLGGDARPGDFVRLSVADTGKGMSAQVLSRIFEPFFTTKEGSKGTGLGLAVAFGIVKQHEGWITCSSEENRGTRFDIYLPRIHPMPADVPIAAAVRPAISMGRGEGILLVDDDPAVRDLFKRALVDAGFHVFLAADGVEALQLYRQHHQAIRLVVLDQLLPGLSGADTLRHLTDIDPEVAVICTTGDANRSSELESNPAISAVLFKPFQLDLLPLTARTCLDKAQVTP
jgi:PAS domain S-box-containing protein